MKHSINRSQILVIILAIAAVFTVYFFGRTTPKNPTAQPPEGQVHSSAAVNINEFRAEAVQQLTEEEETQWTSLKNADLKQQASFWSSIDRNDIASTYRGEIAEQTNSFENWNTAGDLYVRSFRETEDSTRAQYFINQAVSSYENALEYEENSETKIKLAKLFIDVQGEVMKGVMLLQQIVEENPAHVQANYELGLLSIRSGQNEKALERLTTVNKQQPDFIEPYVLKARLLMEQQEKQQALTTLNKALNYANERETKALNEIKNNIINN